MPERTRACEGVRVQERMRLQSVYYCSWRLHSCLDFSLPFREIQEAGSSLSIGHWTWSLRVRCRWRGVNRLALRSAPCRGRGRPGHRGRPLLSTSVSVCKLAGLKCGSLWASVLKEVWEAQNFQFGHLGARINKRTALKADSQWPRQVNPFLPGETGELPPSSDCENFL